jgi:putrescine transport system permease protein
MRDSARIAVGRKLEVAAEPIPHGLQELPFGRWLTVLSNGVQDQWRRLVILLPYVWLLLFFLLPFAIVLKISVAESEIARPPYTALVEWVDATRLQINIIFDNFAYLLQDDLYWKAYLNSLKLAAISTVLCLLLGYPMAYGIARCEKTMRNILLLMVILPFWTSFLLRIYAWIGILENHGVINNVLMWLGLIDQPIGFMYSEFAIFLGILYSYLPFMILPLYANLEKLDPTLNEAAADLGSRPTTTFFTITLPLSVPGIIAGSLLVFIPATGEYVIPALLGGPNSLMIGRVMFDEFFINRDWPVASAVAIVLLFFLVVPIVFFQQQQTKEADKKA